MFENHKDYSFNKKTIYRHKKNLKAIFIICTQKK